MLRRDIFCGERLIGLRTRIGTCHYSDVHTHFTPISTPSTTVHWLVLTTLASSLLTSDLDTTSISSRLLYSTRIVVSSWELRLRSLSFSLSGVHRLLKSPKSSIRSKSLTSKKWRSRHWRSSLQPWESASPQIVTQWM